MSTAIKSLTDKTLIPLGVAVAVLLGAVNAMRSYDGDRGTQAREIVALQGRVDALTDRVVRAEGRIDKTDERWVLVLQELGQIKERLGVVEVKPRKD